jgi:hypothetical protein
MKHVDAHPVQALMLVSLALFISCSNPSAQQSRPLPPASPASAQRAASNTAPAQPAPSPNAAPTVTSNTPAGTPGGHPATEKCTLYVTNYSKVPATVTLNGTWIGEWDASTSVPLDTALQGKNELKVELSQQPKGTLNMEVDARRGEQNVNLLHMTFDSKPPGTYTYYFAAR